MTSAPLLNSRLKLADDVTYQSLGPGSDTVVFSLNSGYLYTCNETSAAFLQALDGQRTLAEVIDTLWEQYEVPREDLTRDMTALASKLLEEKLLVEQP